MRPTAPRAERVRRLIGAVMVTAVIAVVIAAVIGGCIPATPPPHLNETPGPPLVIDGDRITTPALTLTRPPGWRVVTSAAADPFMLVLVAPDECGVIVIRREASPLPDTTCTVDTDEVSAQRGGWTIAGRLPPVDQPLWDDLLASLDEPQPG